MGEPPVRTVFVLLWHLAHLNRYFRIAVVMTSAACRSSLAGFTASLYQQPNATRCDGDYQE
jgi:hypothetical protein